MRKTFWLLVLFLLCQGAGAQDLYKLEWQETFGGEIVDVALALAPTEGGGFLVAGETSSFGAGKNDVYLLKLVPSGR